MSVNFDEEERWLRPPCAAVQEHINTPPHSHTHVAALQLPSSNQAQALSTSSRARLADVLSSGDTTAAVALLAELEGGELDLYGSRLGATGFRTLAAAFDTYNALDAINLDRTGVSGKEVVALLDALVGANNLNVRHLYLGGNGLDDADAAAIGACLKRNRSLTCLGLNQNQIDTAGCLSLCLGVDYCQSLVRVFMRGNPCAESKEGTAALAAMAAACEAHMAIECRLKVAERRFATSTARATAALRSACKSPLELGALHSALDAATQVRAEHAVAVRRVCARISDADACAILDAVHASLVDAMDEAVRALGVCAMPTLSSLFPFEDADADVLQLALDGVCAHLPAGAQVGELRLAIAQARIAPALRTVRDALQRAISRCNVARDDNRDDDLDGTVLSAVTTPTRRSKVRPSPAAEAAASLQAPIMASPPASTKSVSLSPTTASIDDTCFTALHAALDDAHALVAAHADAQLGAYTPLHTDTCRAVQCVLDAAAHELRAQLQSFSNFTTLGSKCHVLIAALRTCAANVRALEMNNALVELCAECVDVALCDACAAAKTASKAAARLQSTSLLTPTSASAALPSSMQHTKSLDALRDALIDVEALTRQHALLKSAPRVRSAVSTGVGAMLQCATRAVRCAVVSSASAIK